MSESVRDDQGSSHVLNLPSARRMSSTEVRRPVPPADPLPPLPILNDSLYAIHYSQELQRNCPDRTPPVSAVVVQQVLTGQQRAFAAFRLAELNGCPRLGFLVCLELLEKM